MVYLREIIQQNRNKILQFKNIETVAYLYFYNPTEFGLYDFILTPEEEIALKGYKREKVDEDKIVSIISKRPIKGMDAASNIYKIAGLYLAAKEKVYKELQKKFNYGNLRQKYFLFKIEPDLEEKLKKCLYTIKQEDPILILLKKLFKIDEITEDQLDNAIKQIIQENIDVQTQIIIEDLENALLKIRYINKDAEELIRDILNNFSNAVQKIIKERRKDHLCFEIKDEYDVQDILYVILKSVFSNLKEEDPIPKVGGKSSKIDLILREEEILIEVKMIRQSAKDEFEFIKQLKIDFESYHECIWLKKLFCFVYDPFKKIKDINNFYDLNGQRVKGNHKFDVEVIVAN